MYWNKGFFLWFEKDKVTFINLFLHYIKVTRNAKVYLRTSLENQFEFIWNIKSSFEIEKGLSDPVWKFISDVHTLMYGYSPITGKNFVTV